MFLESGVVKLALGVSPELQHAPRDVHCTFDLPALLNLVWVADIDDHHVTGSDLLGRLGRRELRNDTTPNASCVGEDRSGPRAE